MSMYARKTLSIKISIENFIKTIIFNRKLTPKSNTFLIFNLFDITKFFK